MVIAAVSELVVGGRKLLEALGGYGGEIACELSVLREDHRAPGHEAVDERLLTHRRLHLPVTDPARRPRTEPTELGAEKKELGEGREREVD